MNKNLKRKFSIEERRDHYQAFKKSGMSHTAFCRASGISKSALYVWKKEFQGGGHFNFSPLVLAELARESVQGSDAVSLEIRLANQVQLHMRLPRDQLISLIRELNYESAITR